MADMLKSTHSVSIYHRPGMAGGPETTVLWFLEELAGPRVDLDPCTDPRSSWAQKPGVRLRADPQKSYSLHGEVGQGSGGSRAGTPKGQRSTLSPVEHSGCLS